MEKRYRRGLVWIRRDLRVHDHRAWSEAEALCDELAVVFVFDTKILGRLAPDDRRVSFVFDSLREVQDELRRRGSELMVLYGDPSELIPSLAQRAEVGALFYNRDYEPYARERDRRVERALAQRSIETYSFKDHVIFESSELLTSLDKPYRVFGPYARSWLQKLDEEALAEAPLRLRNLISPDKIKKLTPGLDLKKAGFQPVPYAAVAGSSGGRKQMRAFLSQGAARYAIGRDSPAQVGGTSRLSVHLRFGTLSTREVLRAIQGKGAGHATWRKEIIWRDFYQMLLASFPQLPEHSFQSKYDSLVWPGTRAHFRAWCEGQTGFPIVDAAMRHFRRTGWMHNRLRMIVASFLTKDLLCSWKWGEEYFAENLLDFDLASNNGGWQWAASVGCDAQPYFRIFNPELQSRRFDPEGKFLRQELPELAALPNKFIHAPGRAKSAQLREWGVELGANYPRAIVDHSAQKIKVLRLFRNL